MQESEAAHVKIIMGKVLSGTILNVKAHYFLISLLCDYFNWPGWGDEIRHVYNKKEGIFWSPST